MRARLALLTLLIGMTVAILPSPALSHGPGVEGALGYGLLKGSGVGAGKSLTGRIALTGGPGSFGPELSLGWSESDLSRVALSVDLFATTGRQGITSSSHFQAYGGLALGAAWLDLRDAQGFGPVGGARIGIRQRIARLPSLGKLWLFVEGAPDMHYVAGRWRGTTGLLVGFYIDAP